MNPELKRELQALTQRLASRPTKLIGTKDFRDQLKAFLDGTKATNLVVLDHGTPRAALLDYETYDALVHLARLITYEVAEENLADLSEEEWQATEKRRAERMSRRRRQPV